MPNAAFYRREAERSRQLAAASNDAEVVMRWLRIAMDYETLANALAGEEKPQQPPITGEPTQQPVQQPQGKLRTDESE